MWQLTQAESEKLSSDQATEIVRIIDLQAKWENHRDELNKNELSHQALRFRQSAFEVFQTAMQNYSAKYRHTQFPEIIQNTPKRLATWCRVLHAVFLRANQVNPSHTMLKVYRLADAIASRLSIKPIDRGIANGIEGAIPELVSIIEWCDALVLPIRLCKLEK